MEVSMSARQKPTGEWQQLRLALEKAGGKTWRESTKHSASTKYLTVITYRFAGRAVALRFASEAKLHCDPETKVESPRRAVTR
jgi:hypothetical protein